MIHVECPLVAFDPGAINSTALYIERFVGPNGVTERRDGHPLFRFAIAHVSVSAIFRGIEDTETLHISFYPLLSG